jgi:aldehyde dehydrogenase (NAD+)
VGEAIVNHPGIDKIAFTGSTEVGRLIRKATAGSGKKLSLELGGKSPFIVFEDADLDAAVEGLVDSIWFNQGQVCCAGSRLLIQESVEERFLAKVRARMDNLRVGSPLDKSMDVGALVDPIQQQRIHALVESARAEGCTVYQPSCDMPEAGSWYLPTLITGASTSAAVAQAEIFGPVLVAMSFRTPAEAVQLANNTVYGLAACVWSESISLALDVAPQIKAGVVWINTANQFDAACGFGGYRESGFGREGGKEGMYEYMTALSEDARPALPVTMFSTPPGRSDVSSTWYRSVAASGCASDGTAITRLPSAIAGATSELKPSRGASFGQMMPITPTGSFSATVMPCIGGWCARPSYLSAHAA